MTTPTDPWGDLPWTTPGEPEEPAWVGLDESCTHTASTRFCQCDAMANDDYYNRGDR